MKIKMKPATKAGKWSVNLGITFAVLMVFKLMLRLPVPTPAIALVGVAGLVVAVVAMFKKDFNVSLLIPLILGVLIILWMAAEFAFPH